MKPFAEKLHSVIKRPKIPWVLRDTVVRMKEAQLSLVASSLAYTTILAIVPFLAISFSIFQAFAGLDKLSQWIEPFIIENLAQGTNQEVMNTIRGFVSNIHAGALGVGGLIGVILTSMSMLSSVEKAINHVWKAQLNRHWFQRMTSYWFFITLGPLSMAVVAGFMSSSKMKIATFLPSGAGGFLITLSALFAIYKWLPNRKVQTSCAMVAASTVALFFAIARAGYSFYIRNFVSYDKIYGSLGAIPILFLWIYIMWLMVLSGAAFSATLQKRIDDL